MSDHHGPGGLDRRTAERLLGGSPDHARLHALLSAAAAPARPEELAGEEAALAAFRDAASPSRASRFDALRRLLTIKALVLIGGSLIATGGAAAYAAINGHLPGRAPTPSPTPTHDEQTTTGGRHSTPVTRVTPPSEPRTPSSASPGVPQRTRSVPSQGQTEAPGKQPSRGPLNNHGSPPHENSGNADPPGRNSNNGSPPGRNSGNGSPPGQNSGNGTPPGHNSGNGTPPGQNSGNGDARPH